MARKSWVTIAFLALAFLTACSREAQQNTSNPTPAVSGPAAAIQSNQYRAVGVVKAINPKAPAIEIDHGNIDGLMPAMEMEFPVTDASLLNGLAVNDRIDFTVENAVDGVKVVAIRKQ
jgi:protein SCO1